jgi:transcriptional regulator of acetoin/glycerol metabolism
MLLNLKRQGVDEHAYFTISTSPVRDNDGEIEGVLCVCQETTVEV